MFSRLLKHVLPSNRLSNIAVFQHRKAAKSLIPLGFELDLGNTAWKKSAADNLSILKWFLFLHGLAFRVLVFCKYSWLKFILLQRISPKRRHP